MNRQALFEGLLTRAAMTRWGFIALIVSLLPFGSFITASLLADTLGVHAPNMIFLCGVILSAIWLGRAAALLTAISSFLVYNYYLTDPRNMLGFGGANDLLTLSIFVVVALLIGGIAGTLHDERNRAREQVRILSELFTASQAMAACTDATGVLHHLVDSSHRIHGGPAALIESAGSGARQIRCAPDDAELPPAVLDRAAAIMTNTAEEPSADPPLNWQIQKLPTPSGAAVLAWREPKGAYASQHAITVELLMKLALAAIERVHASTRQLEDRLRTALLSSISHDFRTPLATIIASSSTLLTYDDSLPAGTRKDLLTSTQEEAERLDRFVGNVLDMTRLEAGVLKPRSEWTDPLELIENVRDRVSKRAGDREVTMNAPAAVPAILVDPVLLEQALINVLDNAIVHTPERCKIEIGARHANGALTLWVEDTGDGVEAAVLTQLFDKFYRPPGASHTAGLGLGLAISKGLVEAMSGDVSAISPVQDGRGLRIEFCFPSPMVGDRV